MYQEDGGFAIADPQHYFASNFDTHLPQTQNDAMQLDFQCYESSSTLPLNLKLSVTTSWVQEINQKLEPPAIGHQSKTTKIIDSDHQDMCKACNFPATYLQIGHWNKTARHDMDITIKFYFKKKKMAVEALDGSLKTKFEVKFADIAAIRFFNLNTSNQGVLEILLDAKPEFFRETNPKPKKHTVWVASHDFTNGEASFCRKHTLRFNPGSLEKLRKRIVAADSLLASLTSQPFPADENPCFGHNSTQISFQNPQQSTTEFPTATCLPLQQDYFHCCQQQPMLQTGYLVDELPCSSPLLPQNQFHSSYYLVDQTPDYYSTSTHEPMSFIAPENDFGYELTLPDYCLDQQPFLSHEFPSFQAPFPVAPLLSSGVGIPNQGESTYGRCSFFQEAYI